MIEQLEAASRKDESVEYELPPIDLLLAGEPVCTDAHEKEVRQQGQDSGKDVRQLRLQSQGGRDRNRAGHRPV